MILVSLFWGVPDVAGLLFMMWSPSIEYKTHYGYGNTNNLTLPAPRPARNTHTHKNVTTLFIAVKNQEKTERSPSERIFYTRMRKRGIKGFSMANHEKEPSSHLYFRGYFWLSAPKSSKRPNFFPKASYLSTHLHGDSKWERQQQAWSRDMMALDNCFLFPFQPSLDWDLQTFELGDHGHEFIPLGG